MKKRGINTKLRLLPHIKNPNKLLNARFNGEILSPAQIKAEP